MHYSKKTVVILFSLIISISLRAQTADEIVKKYVEFIGCQEKWQSIKTITTSGEYDYGGIKFPFQAYSKVPNLYKFIVPFNGKYYAQAFDGTQGWKIDAFKNETKRTILTGKEALQMANEADVELENPFVNYQQKGYQVILEGKDTIQGAACYKVKLTRKDGAIETYYFDIHSAALTMKTAISKNTEMQGSMLDTFYSDYRGVDGVKIPFKAVSKAGDQSILTITIDKAELNKPIDDKEFH
jgi:hypothetical protein